MAPGRYIPLTPAQEGALKHLYRRTDHAHVRSRCQTILLSAQGRSAIDIAAPTFFDQDTVLFWFDRHGAEGLPALHDRPRSGRPPKMRSASRDHLQQAAGQDPRQVGQSFSVWTCRDLAHHLVQKGHFRVAGEPVAGILAQIERDRVLV